LFYIYEMKIRTVVYQLYSDFVVKFYSLEDSIDNYTKSGDVIVTDFLIELHKKIGLQSIGVKDIYRYLIFQFDYWSSKQVSFGDKITLKRVFGKSSLKRYFERSVNFSWYNAELNLSQYQIEPSMISQYQIKKLKNFSELDPQEEMEKQRHLNQDEGLRNCIEGTTLFNHRSPSCTTCRVRDVCKKLLKKNYLGIYIDRGYDR